MLLYWVWIIIRSYYDGLYTSSSLTLSDIVLGAVSYAGMVLYVHTASRFNSVTTLTHLFAVQSLYLP